MINSTRKQVLEHLVELSELCPDIRFGQLIANLSYQARGLSNESIWDMEDEELLVAVKEQLEMFKARQAAPLVSR
ncbi:MAG: hypothetical protein L0211_26490 [Planctomycetaceae bacterium]|nr:hypothetical protein [Planctomycetaceae bacterium]